MQNKKGKETHKFKIHGFRFLKVKAFWKKKKERWKLKIHDFQRPKKREKGAKRMNKKKEKEKKERVFSTAFT